MVGPPAAGRERRTPRLAAAVLRVEVRPATERERPALTVRDVIALVRRVDVPRCLVLVAMGMVPAFPDWLVGVRLPAGDCRPRARRPSAPSRFGRGAHLLADSHSSPGP